MQSPSQVAVSSDGSTTRWQGSAGRSGRTLQARAQHAHARQPPGQALQLGPQRPGELARDRVAVDVERLPPVVAAEAREDRDVAAGVEVAEQVIKLLDMLEDLDDVQNVYSNAELES